MNLTQLAHAQRTLVDGLDEALRETTFEPFGLALYKALRLLDIDVERLQLPLHKHGGLRHPLYEVILITVEDGVASVRTIPHRRVRTSTEMSDNPYAALYDSGERWARFNLREDRSFTVFADLYERGFCDYVICKLPIPASDTQGITVASRTALPDDLIERIDWLLPALAPCLSAVIQRSAALSLAKAYIGPSTGLRVLDGRIYRGRVERLRAGVLFCDVRGFTALAQTVSSEALVEKVNLVFDVIGGAVQANGGEILKFIGDAVLILFACEESTDAQIAQRMHQVVRATHEQLDRRREDGGDEVRVGFGGHIGEVAYGNIGAGERLDFTILGATVNLASRLEGHCGKVMARAVYSAEVADHIDGLAALGALNLKGIPTPTSSWACFDAVTLSGDRT